MSHVLSLCLPGVSVQSLSRVWLFATPWIAAHQASLSIINSQSSPRLMPIESVMPSSHLILCHPLFLLLPIPPSTSTQTSSNLPNHVLRVFSVLETSSKKKKCLKNHRKSHPVFIQGSRNLSWRHDWSFIKKKKFYFVLEYNWLTMLWVSGEQQGPSHTYTCIHSPPNSSSSRLPHNIEQNSLCYTVGPCWLSILNIAVCICPSQTP